MIFTVFKQYSFFDRDILYYYVKMWITIVHDYIILLGFSVF
jgi:hypothetical protein